MPFGAQALMQQAQVNTVLPADAPKKGPPPAVLRGTISDDAGHPLAGALVEWSRGSETDSGPTDDDGNYAFAVPCHCGASLSGGGRNSSAFAVTLTVRANPYAEATKSAQAKSGQSSTVDFKLARRPPSQIGTVQGRITDSTSGEGVEGVKVTITNAGGQLGATTNADGTYTIANVGFATGLDIQVATEVPPCLRPAEGALAVTQAVTEQSFSLASINTNRQTCPALSAASAARNFTPDASFIRDSGHSLVSSSPAGPITSPSPTRPVTPFDLPKNIASIKWQQADSKTIHGSAGGDIWNAGHVNDIFSLKGGQLIVGADTGGVWSIPATGPTLPISTGWNSINISSLAQGPDSPDHFYAGTWYSQDSSGPALWETDTSASILMLLAWSPVQPAPPLAECYTINKVLVIGRKIVLACQKGIWWSEIPPAPSVHGTYKWKQAVGTAGTVPKDLQTAFTGLALGPKEASGESTIIAASGSGVAPSSAVFWGSWSKNELVFRDASVEISKSKTSLKLGRTSLASCAQDLTQVFAVAADAKNNNMQGIWHSRDGGRHFSQVSSPSKPGAQGGYNNAIAVSPDCHATAVGWESGTFVSYNSGGSWNQLVDSSGQYSSLHGDVHALTFDPAQPDTLYIGSDGGVASANGLVQGSAPTFKSSYNRTLFNLQAYHAGASSQTGNLVAVALQDNGALYAKLPGAWEHITNCGCDGGGAKFVATSTTGPGFDLLVFGEWGAPIWPWNWVASRAGSNPVYTFNTQQTIPVGGKSGGLPNKALRIIKSPSHKAGGQFMYAVAGTNTTVYGLFANNDGTSPNWQVLGKVGAGQNVSAVASYDGSQVLIGTDHGRIYQLTPPYTGAGATQLTVHAPGAGKGSIAGILDIIGVDYAIYNDKNSNGYVLEQQEAWNQVGGASLPYSLPFNAIEGEALSSLFVASGAGVYSSSDFGSSWKKASDGLPTAAKGNDLQVVTQPDGKKFLYLATYGWSLWRARLP
jgi:hypothetical protein